MPERFECTSLAKKALYKYSSFPFLLLHKAVYQLNVRLSCNSSCYNLSQTVVVGCTILTLSHHRNCFTAVFQVPPGWAGARSKLRLDFMVLGRITRGRLTDNPCGRHAIRTNQQSTSINPPFLCRMRFLPQPSRFILGWDRHRTMLDCISPLLNPQIHLNTFLAGLCPQTGEPIAPPVHYVDLEGNCRKRKGKGERGRVRESGNNAPSVEMSSGFT